MRFLESEKRRKALDDLEAKIQEHMLRGNDSAALPIMEEALALGSINTVYIDRVGLWHLTEENKKVSSVYLARLILRHVEDIEDRLELTANQIARLRMHFSDPSLVDEKARTLIASSPRAVSWLTLPSTQ